jgi:RND family efflux transporter MFP subunit
MTQRTCLLLASLALMAAVHWGCKADTTAAPPPAAAPTALAVKAIPAERTEWTVTVPFSGSLKSKSIVEVKSEVAGRLVEARFIEGDHVRKGQALAEIDPTNYRLAHEQAQASLAVAEPGLQRAQVVLDHARREKERADNLLRTGGITEKDHQAATTGVRDAEAQVQLAEAQRQQVKAAISIAEKALRDCRIVAPADGHIQKKFVDAGTLLSAGQSIYTVVDNSRLELDCLLPAYRLAEIRPGLRARFTTPTFAEREFEAVVSAINPMIESDNRAVKVALRIANSGELRSGMFARGNVEVRRQPDALVIPRSALASGQENSATGTVYVVRNNTAARREVRIGGVQQDRIWVQTGIEPGELVIVEIGPALKDGSAIRLLTDSSATVG